MVITLIGMMGSGKSTVGAELSCRLNWRFFDLDDVISRKTGVSIPRIFSVAGERTFRSWERRSAAEIYGGLDRGIVATGGGAILSSHNRRIFFRSGPVFYLHADPAVLLERMDLEGRPLLSKSPDPEARIRDIFRSREKLYEMGFKIETGDRSPEEVADSIIEILL